MQITSINDNPGSKDTEETGTSIDDDKNDAAGQTFKEVRTYKSKLELPEENTWETTKNGPTKLMLTINQGSE